MKPIFALIFLLATSAELKAQEGASGFRVIDILSACFAVVGFVVLCGIFNRLGGQGKLMRDQQDVLMSIDRRLANIDEAMRQRLPIQPPDEG